MSDLCLQCPEGARAFAVTRGLCAGCYQRSSHRVRRGETTWEALEQEGQALPPQRRPSAAGGMPAYRHGDRVRLAFGHRHPTHRPLDAGSVVRELPASLKGRPVYLVRMDRDGAEATFYADELEPEKQAQT